MLELSIDNDVLIKLSRYDLLDGVPHVTCAPDCDGAIGVLSTARLVCEKRLASVIASGDANPDTLATFNTFIGSVYLLEPTDDELRLAGRLEDAAQLANVAMDAGESILLAISATRGNSVLTGDKRAVVAMEALLDAVPELAQVAGRIICLEQALVTLSDALGPLVVRARVCSDPAADTSLRIALECGRAEVGPDFEAIGLRSYIDDLRATAPRSLSPGYALALAS